jgi:hypothetical protein
MCSIALVTNQVLDKAPNGCHSLPWTAACYAAAHSAPSTAQSSHSWAISWVTLAAPSLSDTARTHPPSPTTAAPPAQALSLPSAAGTHSTTRAPTHRRCTARSSADLARTTRTRTRATTSSRMRSPPTTTQASQVRELERSCQRCSHGCRTCVDGKSSRVSGRTCLNVQPASLFHPAKDCCFEKQGCIQKPFGRPCCS